MNKNETRAILKTRLNDLYENERIKLSNNIKDYLIPLIESLNYKSINIYASFQNEVITDSIIDYLLKNNYIVSLPILFNETLKSIKIDSFTKYKENKYGIKEPIKSIDQEFEIIIVPLLGFDKNKNRLGRGKGYYDRFLENKNVIKIGLGYSIQEIDSLPINDNDIKMDYIITEKGIIK